MNRLLLWLLLLFPVSSLAQSDTEGLLEQARTAFAESDYYHSLELLHQYSPEDADKQLRKYLLQLENHLELSDLAFAESLLSEIQQQLAVSETEPEESLLLELEMLKGRIKTFRYDFEEAKSIFEAALAKSDTPDQEIRIKISQAALLVEMQKDQAAADSLHQILSGLSETEYPLEVLKAMQIQAMAFGYLGQLDTAIHIYSATLDLCDQYLPPDHYYKAISLHQIGTQYLRKGQAEKAIPYSLSSLSIFDIRFKGDHPNYGQLYNNIGIMYVRKGDLIRSLDYFEKALAFKESGPSPDPGSLANTHLNIGSISFNLNRHRQASIHLGHALKLRKESGDKGSARLALVYQLLAQAAGETGDFEKAHLYLDSCQKIRTGLMEAGAPAVGRVYLKRTALYLKEMKSRESLDYAGQTLQFWEEFPSENQSDMAGAWSNLALAQSLNGQDSAALVSLKKAKEALAVYQNAEGIFLASDRIFLLEILLTEAETQEHIAARSGTGDDWEKALEKFNDAFRLLNWLRKDISSEQGRAALNSMHYSVFEGLIRLYFDKWEETGEEVYLENAFIWAEKSKAALLLDALKASQAQSFHNVPPDLIEQEKTIQEEWTTLEKQLFSGKEDSELNEKLFEVKEAHAALLEVFRQDYPQYYAARFSEKVSSLSEIREKLGTEEALLAYFLGEEGTFVFVIDAHRFSGKRLPGPKEWQENISLLRTGLSGYYEMEHPLPEDYSKHARLYTESAYKLYLDIVKPLGNLPANLLIIPDGILWYLPFGALLNEAVADATRFRSHPYLLHSHSVSYAISSTWWAQQQKQLGELTRLLCVAPHFPDLIFNQEEAAVVADIGGGELISGEQATISWFRDHSQDYNAIHLSTHARINDQNSDFCFLEFAGEPNRLFIKDLYNFSLPLDMVVLSACHAGFGETERGEGVISLARAFAYAGARSMVTSFWQVDDRSGKAIMESFYQELKRGTGKRLSLRQAQLNYIASQRENRLASPYFWASFHLIGNTDALKFEQKNNTWIYGLILLLLITSAVFGFRRKAKNTRA